MNAASDLRVRPANPADLEALVALEAACFLPEDRFPRRSFRRLLMGTNVVLLAELEGRVVGQAILLFRATSKVARLYSLSADPSVRGRGLGRALLEASEDAARARGADRQRLEVRASNEAALRLYRLAGYTTLGEKPGYYPDGETALHLEKALESPPTSGGMHPVGASS